jgi:hypothetical protein
VSVKGATKIVPTELQEHRLLVAYLRTRNYKFTHVANETGTNAKWIGIRNKQNGVSPGFPDFLIIVGNQLIAIELKRIRYSETSTAQLEWLKALNNCGIPAQICKGYDAAVAFIEQFVTNKEHDNEKEQF